MAEAEGGKGGGSSGEDQGTKFQKGGDKDLSSGPVKKRCCTDIICLPIFFVHIALFWVISFAGMKNGNPMKLIKMRDYQGNYCGVKENWNSGPDLENMEKQMWTINLDSALGPKKVAGVDGPIYMMVCKTSVGRQVLVEGLLGGTKMPEADYKKYCDIADMPTFDSTVDAAKQAAQAAEKMKSEVQDKIAKFSDPNEAVKMFTGGGGGGGGGLASKLFKEMAKYFNQVCLPKCEISRAAATADYTYVPNPTISWADPTIQPKAGPITFPAYKIWQQFLDNINNADKSNPATKAAVETFQAGISKFQFKAFPKEVCPYDTGKCVPMPGTTFEEVSNWGMCIPKINPEVMAKLGGALGESVQGLSKLAITEDTKKTFGDLIGDVIKTYDVFIIVACLSFVLGLVVLVLMRFILAPLVWGALLLIFLVFVGGGLAVIVRSGQCANQSYMDAAKAQSSTWEATATAGDGANPFDAVECPGGFSIENEDARKAAKYAGYVVLGIAGIWALGVLCMLCRIRLAIAINQVACMFLYANPQVLLVPIIQNIIGIIWIFVWGFTAAFLISQVPDDYTPMGSFATYDIAYGTADTPGQCTDKWPTGAVYIDDTTTPACGTNGLCYRCSPPRYIFDARFGYSFFSYLWHNFFFVALGQCIIAGAVGIWFFTKSGEKWKKATVLVSVKNALLWHTGSLAFGSLILAIVVWLKWFMHYLSEQAKATKNKVMEIVCKILGYCLWCFEKIIKFLNKNAYIQIALMGTNFCTSAKNAFFLILRNALRFAVITMLSHIVHLIGMVLITAATGVVGYFILGAMYEDVNPILPTIFYVFIGAMTAKLFIGCFALAVDATLQCFIAAEEMGGEAQEFCPAPLKSFIDKQEGQGKKCCDTCCCTVL